MNKLRGLASTVKRSRGNQPDPFDSWFEVDVYISIVGHGFRVIPQYQVAGYRIDLVIEGTKNQLAVECDGDEWHGIEQDERDVARQRVLERCGWRFWRIRGSEYYRDPEGSLESLWRTLSEMGIHPLSDTGFDEEDLSKHEQCSTVEGIGGSYRASNGIGLADITAVGEEREPIWQTPALPDSLVQQPQAQESKPESITQRVAESEIYNYPANFFFSLAHWAKEGEKLKPWERRLIFDIGRYRTRGWQISEKKNHQALRIVQEAIEAGFSEAKG